MTMHEGEPNALALLQPTTRRASEFELIVEGRKTRQFIYNNKFEKRDILH